MIKDLEKRKDKAMERSDTDDFWIKIESLQWVLFVIFAIKNGNMVGFRFLPLFIFPKLSLPEIT
jgi:uncharacterized integral membrane protein